jgi:DHA1 family bicyclomycin/chloramphenicol resistance-like MFS transporter
MSHHPTHNPTVVILILGSLSTISPFAIDMYLPAFPEIATDLHTTTARVSLSVASYFAGLAAGQLIYGPLLDRFGRKPPMYSGLALFVVASLLCLWARSIEWLIAMRFLQALGGCGAQVASMAMVRDFFPVQETAKIISWLILILGVSPLLAPTVGGFVASHLGWKFVFVMLGIVAAANLALCMLCLPDGHRADATVSLHPVPIMRNFIEVVKERQFITFSSSGAFAFSGLLVYVAGAPIIFMEVFHVSAHQFGGIFAGLAVGFIGSNQINVLLLRKFTSAQIYLCSLLVVCPVALIFLVGTVCGWFGLGMTLVLLFILLSSIGLAFPNAAALAMSPFDRNIGSASSMLGFLQIGISGLASVSVGIFDSRGMLPVAVVLAVTSWIGLGIFLIGKRKIGKLRFVEEQGATPIAH